MKHIKDNVDSGVTTLSLTQDVRLQVSNDRPVRLGQLKEMLDDMVNMLGQDAVVYIRQTYYPSECIEITNNKEKK